MLIDIKRPLKKFSQIFLQAREENLTEADTVNRLIKFFGEVLGYSDLEDISSELKMKNGKLDIVLKIDGIIRMIVEAKRASVALRESHINQAEEYAFKNNYPWVVLTNGVEWRLYHVAYNEGIDSQLAFSIDLSEKEDFDQAVSNLALLHKKAIRKGDLDDFWQKTTALSSISIGRSLFEERILKVIRAEIKRKEKHSVDIEDLAIALFDMLSPIAQGAIGKPRIRKSRPKLANKTSAKNSTLVTKVVTVGKSAPVKKAIAPTTK